MTFVYDETRSAVTFHRVSQLFDISTLFARRVRSFFYVARAVDKQRVRLNVFLNVLLSTSIFISL